MIANSIFKAWLLEAVAQSCSVKKVFLRISQNSQENTCARLSGTGVFLWILRKFSRTPFLQNTSGGCFYLVKALITIPKLGGEGL